VAGVDDGAGSGAEEMRSRDPVPPSPELVIDSVIARPLQELMAESAESTPLSVVAELRNTFPGGTPAAAERVRDLVADIRDSSTDDAAVGEAIGSYLTVRLTPAADP
jgi:serine protease AprX